MKSSTASGEVGNGNPYHVVVTDMIMQFQEIRRNVSIIYTYR